MNELMEGWMFILPSFFFDGPQINAKKSKDATKIWVEHVCFMNDFSRMFKIIKLLNKHAFYIGYITRVSKLIK